VSDWIESGTVTAPTRKKAALPFPMEPVRALEAIHLATALEFTRAFPDLRVLSLDRRVADNAIALGI